MSISVKTRKKLIEVALPLPEINDASAYDKMPGIGPHPKGIHQWWARLPLPTARAILFASVVDDPSEHPESWPSEDAQTIERERLFDILRQMMGKKLHTRADVYAEAREEMLKHCNDNLPSVVDPFSGGGSIPLEANRMGFDAHASDLNPVAVLLNKCNLEIAPRWIDSPPVNQDDRQRIGGGEGWRGTIGLASDVRYYARLIQEHARQTIGNLYPQVEGSNCDAGSGGNVIAWIWVRTVASPNPAAKGRYVPIAGSFVLSSKNGKATWLEPVLDEATENGWRVELRHGPATKDNLAHARLGTKAGKAQDFICVLTKTPIQRSYIQAEGKAGRLRSQLLAVVADGKSGRLYLPAENAGEAADVSSSASEILHDARATLLSGSLPTRAEITGGVCTAYGLATWGHLFTDRQLLSLLTLSDLIRESHNEIKSAGLNCGLSNERADQYAKDVCTFLALSLDRCTDFNNVLCRWSPSNEKVMNLFGKQALPMVFDYAEANLLGASVGSWDTCSAYVADCIEVLSTGKFQHGVALQLDASAEQSETKDILVSTDPPYYNNISYAVLSDFFYVWLRRSIGAYYPDLFNTVLAPKTPELIAASNRFDGDVLRAKQHFEDGFRATFTALRQRMDERFPLTVYYAFKQEDEDQKDESGEGVTGVDLTTGWETLLEALISSGFQITATWPVRASQKWRMVSMGTNALASYIVLACRPRQLTAMQTDRRSFIVELRRELPAALRRLQQGNIAPVDFAQASIGPGMAIYSRYSQILESDGNAMTVRSALGIVNQTLSEVLSEQQDEFDPHTRWAVTWFDQNGFAEGEFGDAELLSKAKVTSVHGLQVSGLILSKAGKVRLLRPDELDVDWNPETKSQLTGWGIVHHLAQALQEGGELACAMMFAKLGNEGNAARELAYLLYSICERRKRTQEALPYNALVQSWPEIQRLAREQETRPAKPQQTTMFS